MPEPSRGETKDDFLSRCMGDSEANSSFPDEKQRYAFCNSQWNRKDQMALKVTKAPPADTNLVSVGEQAILDEFDDKDLSFDKAKLELIVERNNKRYADTGDMSPLVLGHTDGDAPESEQPPIVGYARNFRLGTLGAVNPRPAIFAEFLALPDKLDEFKQRPRRSVEVWPDGLIDPIALLGATTPRRSLGLLLSKDGGRHNKRPGLTRRFEFNPEKCEMDKEELAKLVLDTMAASPMGQFVQKMMDEQSAPPETPAEETAEEPNAPPAKAAKKQTVKVDDSVRLERDQLAIKFAQLEKAQAETKAAADAATLKLRRTEREAALKQLSYEGFVFDLAKEMSHVETLDDAAYGKHVESIKLNYRRNSVGSSPVPSAALSFAADQSTSARQAKAKAMAEYARKNKCSMKDAEKALAAAK